MNTIFGTNSSNSGKGGRANHEHADKTCTLSQVVKDVGESSHSRFSKEPPPQKRTISATLWSASAQSPLLATTAPKSGGCIDFAMLQASTTSLLVDTMQDDDDRFHLPSLLDESVATDDTDHGAEKKSTGEDAAMDVDDGVNKENQPRDVGDHPLSHPPVQQRNCKFVFDFPMDEKASFVTATKEDGAKENGGDELDSQHIDRITSAFDDKRKHDALSSATTSVAAKIQKMYEPSKQLVPFESRDEAKAVDGLTQQLVRNSTFVFDHSNGGSTNVLFPHSALRTADGTAATRSPPGFPRRFVSFAPVSHHRHYDDPVRKSRFQFKADLWFSGLELKEARFDGDLSIYQFRNSRARTRMILHLWKRQRDEMSLHSPLTKQLLLQLVYHQVGKPSHFHCVGMERFCEPSVVADIQQNRKCLRRAILQAQASSDTIVSSWENLSFVSMQYSERSRAFALAVGTALDVAVTVEDRLGRDEEDAAAIHY